MSVTSETHATHESEKKSTPRLLSRREVSRILDRSQTTIRREYDGKKLHPIEVRVYGKRRLRYDPLEVGALREQLARRKREAKAVESGYSVGEGEIAARVFELLREGRTKVEIVIETKVPPDVVSRLREQYLRSFDDEDRARKSAEVARRDKVEAQEHARGAARERKEERGARTERRQRREQMMSFGKGGA